MQQQALLDELHSRSEELTKHAQAALVKLTNLKASAEDGDTNASSLSLPTTGRLDRESQVREKTDGRMD
jgi:hypothetical protein